MITKLRKFNFFWKHNYDIRIICYWVTNLHFFPNFTCYEKYFFRLLSIFLINLPAMSDDHNFLPQNFPISAFESDVLNLESLVFFIILIINRRHIGTATFSRADRTVFHSYRFFRRTSRKDDFRFFRSFCSNFSALANWTFFELSLRARISVIVSSRISRAGIAWVVSGWSG